MRENRLQLMRILLSITQAQEQNLKIILPIKTPVVTLLRQDLISISKSCEIIIQTHLSSQERIERVEGVEISMILRYDE
jgi:hypothetical protein